MITTCNDYSEDSFVEQPAIEPFRKKFCAHGILRSETKTK